MSGKIGAPENAPRGRGVADSRVEMTELVMPPEINARGSVFGGWVMAQIDKAAAIAAMRHCRGPVATASMDSIDFLAPMKLGDVVRMSAFLTQAFHTSMEVEVEVHSEHPTTGERAKTCTAFITMVALGPDGKPVPVPPLELVSEQERRVAAAAEERRRQRLARRGRSEP